MRYIYSDSIPHIVFTADDPTITKSIKFDEILDSSSQIKSLLKLPSPLQIISMQHFNYDEFGPKRHINKKKIASEMNQEMKN